MTDTKFTDEEIIKALECHIKAEDCEGCEMFGGCEEIILTERVLDLINRQKAEIEKLKGSTIVNNIMESQKIKKVAKAEAYKEFAEKLTSIGKRDDAYGLVSVFEIAELLKEMVGEKE